MNIERREVSTVSELQEAAADASVRQIVISAPIGDMPTLRLSAGQMLTATDEQSALSFGPGSHGLELSADNRVERLRLIADVDKRIIFTPQKTKSNDAPENQIERSRLFAALNAQ